MKIEEGRASLDLPGDATLKGPGSKGTGFYNRSQRINRDLTLIFLSAKRPERVLDAFGGSGVRGIRVAKEIGIETVISETNPASASVIKNNIALSEADVEVYNESYEKTLERGLFDFIDIDPYGSVIPHTDKAITSVKNGGYIAFTATDLSALTGSVPSKTLRRYQSYIVTDLFKHEMGIRLLLSYIARRAAVFDFAVYPELSFWYSHFYRVIVRVERGAGKADRVIRQIGVVNKNTLLSNIYDDVDEGPLWTGSLENPDTISAMSQQKLETAGKESLRYTEILGAEDRSLLFLELTDMAKSVRSNIPPLEDVKKKLMERSIGTDRTHFSPTGLKVDGDMNEAYDITIEHMKKNYR